MSNNNTFAFVCLFLVCLGGRAWDPKMYQLGSYAAACAAHVGSCCLFSASFWRGGMCPNIVLASLIT